MGAGVVQGVDGAVYTFLFTDIEGSTRRWQAEPDAMPRLLAAHDEVLRSTVESHRGRVFKHTGDGMCAVFGSVADAVVAAVEAQRDLELPVRMGVHTGEAADRGGDFFGFTLNRCARLMDAAHGGQVLVSAGSAAVVGDLGEEIELRDLGEHRLRDLGAAERIFQVLAPGLSVEFAPLRTLDAVRHNLPVLRSSFVGRELELIEVSDRLGSRLVTLTGVGGCGKTRLALEAAAGLTDRFPQGVFFVDLAVLSDPELLGQAVASALGLQLTDVGIESLSGYLAKRRVLVVLDNCEHVLDACAELVEGLLARCPELRILATSREALGVEGEEVFRVPSLNVETDAVRLFMDRSRAAGAQIQSDDAVARICQRLDGIPLAIELAAARATHLSPTQILERLSDRFRLLTGGRRRVQRQQTLSAAIDWSHDLLGEDERSLFRRLAVFRGTFSLTAVEEICHPDAVDLLGSLVEKSLVNLHEDGRYRLLETVRVYAEERLVESGEADAIRSAHRDWFLDWVEAIPLGKTVAIGAGEVLVPEADNLAAALEWSLEDDRLDLVARIASRMTGYWTSYVLLADIEAWWRALADNLDRLSERDRASALLVGAVSTMLRGDWMAMVALSAKALELAPRDSWVAAAALWLQAAMWVIADPERGRRCIDEGVQSARAAGDPELEHMFVAVASMELTGDPERDAALRGGGMIEDLLPTIGDHAPGTEFNVLGAAAALGNQKASERLLSQIQFTSPFHRFMHALIGSLIATNERRIEAAGRHLQAATAVVREHAMPLGEASCLIGFSALAASAGDHERASRDLACVKSSGAFQGRGPVDVLVYRITVRALRGALDPETAARCRAEGAAMSVSEALDAELARLENAGHGNLASRA